jgi:hypothetical protein
MRRTEKNILELSNEEARKFFLKSQSYCSIEMPRYFSFDKILSDVDNVLKGKKLLDFYDGKKGPENYDNVNYTLLSNKDGRYAWRPFQLIHPALYVSLVHEMTERKNWETIRKKFEEYSENKNIQCMSIPIVSQTQKNYQGVQILNWWLEIEQKSIELSLDYDYLFVTDITDCYASIYTHSISWALHSKTIAKEKRKDKSLIGNIIDKHIQQMQNGQTNGIPQGSVLMDFIAEIVLGYADTILSERIHKENINNEDYFILRYRDDYRLFVNNPQIGEMIIKLLTETLYELGLKINSSKTRITNTIVQSSLKSDKLHWITNVKKDENLQKHLLIIHNHAVEYPNSGSVSRALDEYHKRLIEAKEIQNPTTLIAIVVDIALLSPRTYSLCASIISELLRDVEINQKQMIIEKILKKFNKVPNIGHLQVWLQRITLSLKEIKFEETLCKLVNGEKVIIWNSDWIKESELKKVIISENIINRKIKAKLSDRIPRREIQKFPEYN